MSKKIISYILCALITLCFFGCNKTENETVENIEVITSSVAQEKHVDYDVDIDLSQGSGNIAYSQVYNMFSAPEDYNGKTVVICGIFNAIYENVEENDLRFTCQISDATACCSIGLEFVPGEDMTFPVDFPTDGSKITVTGTLCSKGRDVPIYISNAIIQY